MKQKIVTAFCIMVGWSFALLGVDTAQATIFLQDGKLQLNGYVKEQAYIRTHIPKGEEQFHKSKINFLRTSALLETLYKVREENDFSLNLFAGVHYWYEAAPKFDHEMWEGIPQKMRQDYIRPSGDDLISEAYVDIIKGPWQFKIGKQIAVWGETDLQRTADVINPLDLRYGSPGTENWEDIKIGLYMIRAFYQSQLPGQLLFETLFIPGHFEEQDMAVEGTFRGPSQATTSFNPGKIDGIYWWQMEKARKDAPGWNLKENWELGFRVRGFTWDVDWSLFYFNTLSDAPTANPNRITPYTLVYVLNGLGSVVLDENRHPNVNSYHKKVFNYKRYEVIGGTLQTIVDRLHGSEWRLEYFYEIGNHWNKGTRGKSNAIYDEVKRDIFGFGMTYADRFTLPYVGHHWFDDKKMTLSLTFFYEKVINHDIDLVLDSGRGHRPGDAQATNFTWSFQQFAFNSKLMFMFTGSYNPIGKWFMSPIVSYAPGDHWRYEACLAMYGSRAVTNRGTRYWDGVLLRVRYEF